MTQSRSSSMRNLAESADDSSISTLMSGLCVPSSSSPSTLFPYSRETRSASICISQVEGHRQGKGTIPEMPQVYGGDVEEVHPKEKHNFAHKMLHLFSKDKRKDSSKSHKSPTNPYGYLPNRPEVAEWSIPKYVPRDDNIVVSGHPYFNTLYASNDTTTPSFSINALGAPNDSTLVCGCENTECPFCNLVLSIQNNQQSGVDLP